MNLQDIDGCDDGDHDGSFGRRSSCAGRARGRGDRRKLARRGRTQGRAGRGRAGHRPSARAVSGRLRRDGRGERPPALGRCAVPHRLHDQGDHLGRRHAARRAGPPESRRSGREISAGARQPEGDRIVQRGDRRLQAASGGETADGAALPDPHVRARVPLHQRDLARFQAAQRRDNSRSAGRCCSIRASAGITARAPTWSASWSRKSPGRSSRTISASTSSPRSR